MTIIRRVTKLVNSRMSKTDKREPERKITKGFLDKVAYKKVGIKLSNVTDPSVKRHEPT